MLKLGLYVRLEAKPGKESEAEQFLRDALPAVQDEPGTTAWFALRLGPSTFGLFDAFETEEGRESHLNGKVAAALMDKATELFGQPPTIEKVDLLAVKMP